MPAEPAAPPYAPTVPNMLGHAARHYGEGTFWCAGTTA
jgi:hypothetical protein